MRIKLLTAILATHNITPDKIGTVIEMEDEGRANELIALGYAEKTSAALTPHEETAGGAHAIANAQRLADGRNQEAALAAGKAAKAQEEAEKANAEVAKAADPKAGAPENKDAGAKATTSTKVK